MRSLVSIFSSALTSICRRDSTLPRFHGADHAGVLAALLQTYEIGLIWQRSSGPEVLWQQHRGSWRYWLSSSAFARSSPFLLSCNMPQARGFAQEETKTWLSVQGLPAAVVHLQHCSSEGHCCHISAAHAGQEGLSFPAQQTYEQQPACHLKSRPAAINGLCHHPQIFIG